MAQAIQVDGLSWGSQVEEKLRPRGLDDEIAEQVRARKPLFFLDKQLRANRYMMIRPALDGRFYTVIIERTQDEGIWSVITGWPSHGSEIRLYNSNQGEQP